MLEAGERFGRSDVGAGRRIQVEYVSANPTGPLNVVSARAAAVGAALVRLLRATGHEAEGEFYVNDAGNQVDLLGASVAARFAERIGRPRRDARERLPGRVRRDARGAAARGRSARRARPRGRRGLVPRAGARRACWRSSSAT